MLNIKKFFELLKAAQQPAENRLTAAMQVKVDWIKKATSYNLNDRQKQALERDKELVVATENYISILHQTIARLGNELEQLNTLAASHFTDKLEAERALVAYIENDRKNGREVHTAA